MKQLLLTLLVSCLVVACFAQQKKYAAINLFNTQNAMPFAKLSSLFSEVLHPGIEVKLGKNLSVKNKHDWFSEINLAYFVHRYVQHGIPVYIDFGYRYKFSKALSARSSLGGGYMHSIPATAKLKLDDDGEYKNDKGLGRMQAIAVFDLGAGYSFTNKSKKSFSINIAWQQRVQMPFVKSYVPLLPYNSFLTGISFPL
jgi:hypothetical protein